MSTAILSYHFLVPPWSYGKFVFSSTQVTGSNEDLLCIYMVQRAITPNRVLPFFESSTGCIPGRKWIIRIFIIIESSLNIMQLTLILISPKSNDLQQICTVRFGALRTQFSKVLKSEVLKALDDDDDDASVNESSRSTSSSSSSSPKDEQKQGQQESEKGKELHISYKTIFGSLTRSNAACIPLLSDHHCHSRMMSSKRLSFGNT